jgi:hypothetical protein
MVHLYRKHSNANSTTSEFAVFEILRYQNGEIVSSYISTKIDKDAFCEFLGKEKDCENCMYYIDGKCTAQYKVVNNLSSYVEEIEKKAKDRNMSIEKLVDLIKSKDTYFFDVTGHLPIGKQGCDTCWKRKYVESTLNVEVVTE